MSKGGKIQNTKLRIEHSIFFGQWKWYQYFSKNIRSLAFHVIFMRNLQNNIDDFKEISVTLKKYLVGMQEGWNGILFNHCFDLLYSNLTLFFWATEVSNSESRHFCESKAKTQEFVMFSGLFELWKVSWLSIIIEKECFLSCFRLCLVWKARKCFWGAKIN